MEMDDELGYGDRCGTRFKDWNLYVETFDIDWF